VPQLKDLLKAKNLPRTGKKADLVKRALRFKLIVDAAAIADEVAAIVPDVAAMAEEDANVAVTAPDIVSTTVDGGTTAAEIAPVAANGDAADMDTETLAAEEGATQCIAWIAS